MKALELFCGTKCAGKVLENMGYKVVSLDFNKKFEPTICIDICDWDYTDYDPKEFDIIWASPECKTFTFSAGGKHRKKDNIMGKTQEAEDGNKMVDAMLKILEYFKPKKYFVENPLGLMRYYPGIKKHLGDPLLVWYANYGWGHPKPTHIWSNVKLWENEKRPQLPDDWWVMRAGKRRYKAFDKGTPETRSMIPTALIKKLFVYDKDALPHNTIKEQQVSGQEHQDQKDYSQGNL